MTFDEKISLFSSAKLPTPTFDEHIANCINNSYNINKKLIIDYLNESIESPSFTTFITSLNTETIKALLWKLNIELNQRSDP